jgi:glycosyltransferase involved in cell wall biosynthesis
VALIDNPWWRPYINLGDYRVVCYDLMDLFGVFSGRFEYGQFEVWERELLGLSDVVFYTADSLREHASSRTNARLVSLPNAGDPEFFRHQSTTLPVPADIAAVPGPRVGFVGSVFRWLDFSLMAQVMKSMPDVSFVFIGPVENWRRLAALTELANFHHLGVKPYSEVAAYENAFDVCICPFKTDDIGQAVDPVKIYEYFALGKPVVATRIHELTKLQPMTLIADNADEFVLRIRQGLSESNPELSAQRVSFALENSWARRVDRFLEVVEEELMETSPGVRNPGTGKIP